MNYELKLTGSDKDEWGDSAVRNRTSSSTWPSDVFSNFPPLLSTEIIKAIIFTLPDPSDEI
jgi:hypothetical protein